MPDVPPPGNVPADPVQLFRARHEAEGLVLHATTATPGWFGERLDVGWAIDVLHPAARQVIRARENWTDGHYESNVSLPA